MYSTGVIAHRRELFWFIGMGRVGSIVDSFGRPDAYVAIYFSKKEGEKLENNVP